MTITKIERQNAPQIPVSASEAIRWTKLASCLGLALAEIEVYHDYSELICSSKLARLRFREDLPSYDEYVQLREMWNNARCEYIIENTRNENNCSSEVEKVYPLASAECKVSSMMGIAPQDFEYYNRYGKAARVLGSSPKRQV